MIDSGPRLARPTRIPRTVAALGAAVMVAATSGAVAEGPQNLLESVVASPTAPGLRAWHDLLGSEPHVAGGPGDAAVIDAIAGAFQDMGLETEV